MSKPIGFNIPRYYYRATLEPSAATDYIEFEVERPAGDGPGHATLRLDAQSPGKPGKKGAAGGDASLTNVEITVTAPRCTIEQAAVKPVPSGLTVSPAGTIGWCTWRHHKSPKGKSITYRVPFRTSQTETLRFEFIVRAAELVRPIRLHHDMRVTAQVKPESISVPTAKPAKPKAKPAGKSAGASG
jgi:hypothetical protein